MAQCIPDLENPARLTVDLRTNTTQATMSSKAVAKPAQQSDAAAHAKAAKDRTLPTKEQGLFKTLLVSTALLMTVLDADLNDCLTDEL